MERSFVIIKPDGTVRRRIGALVIKALLERGYRVRAFKEMRVTRRLAEMHYAVHSEKPFFSWLVDFITSAPVLVLIFQAENVIQGIRDALGSTFVQKAEPSTLRGKYGIWAGVNIAHASDASETASEEIRLWTSEGGVVESDDAGSNALDYIERYAVGDTDFTMEIRSIVRDAIEERDTSETILESLTDLLRKDANGIENQEIEALARVIHEFVLEEIEKQ
ncbi:MAG: nucleoside-diphosphate kinase [Candidatus Thorarchaeota archaeon]|nr:MAG: nucleoside-diphosphate kinase [Candidatus Thorarchaeota archaeon]